ASGTLIIASGPAWCSPLKGVGFVTSKPHVCASFGLLNQKPTWNVLIGFTGDSSRFTPKIWSARMVWILTRASPSSSACTSGWYQARPKLGGGEIGLPWASSVLRCTVNRSNARFGLMLCRRRVRRSFRSPFSTSTLAVGGRDGSFGYFARQLTNFGFGVSWKLVSVVPLAAYAAMTDPAATATAAARTAISERLGRIVLRDISSPFDGWPVPAQTPGTPSLFRAVRRFYERRF